jgi:hypothetical protein
MDFLVKTFLGKKIPWSAVPWNGFPWKKISLLCRITIQIIFHCIIHLKLGINGDLSENYNKMTQFWLNFFN